MSWDPDERPEPDMDHYPDLAQGMYAVAPVGPGRDGQQRALWPRLDEAEEARAILRRLRDVEAERDTLRQQLAHLAGQVLTGPIGGAK